MDPLVALPMPDVESLADDAPTFVSLYSGCGGLDLGFTAAGFRPVWANEMDPHAVDTYRRALGDHVVHASIDEVELPSLVDVDLVVGGPPCQGFSVAGQRRYDDPRSRHVFRFMDVVEHVSPRAFVLENVKALGVNARWEHVRQRLLQRAVELGYTPHLVVLNAADYGVAQRRERMFLIGSRLGVVDAPEPIGAHMTVRDALALLPAWGTDGNDEGSTAKISPAKNPVLRRSPYRGSLLFNGKGRPLDLDDSAPTIPASMGGNATPIVEQRRIDGATRSWVASYHRGLVNGKHVESSVGRSLRRITVAEAAALQSFPIGMEFRGPLAAKYRQIGNAVPPLLALHVARAVARHLNSGARAQVRELSMA